MVHQKASLSDQFIASENLCNLKISRTGVEARYSLGIGERYHQPLSSTFQMVSLDYSTIPKSLVLIMCVDAMKDTIRSEAFVPSSFAFGEYPKLRMDVNQEVKAILSQKAGIANKAIEGTAHHIAKLRLQ